MPGEKFSVARNAGRLLECRIFALWTDADAEQYARSFWTAARATPGDAMPVLLADHRPVRAYTVNVLARIDAIFASLNVKLERVAILTDRNNVAVTVQLQRAVDRAGFVNRRLYTEPAGALAHLHDSLTLDERARAKAFVAEWPAR